MEHSPSWAANWFLQLVKKFPAFLEPEGSSPYSQVPATCPYPEPTPSSPRNPLPLPEDLSKYYPPICVWVSPMVSFPQVSPPEPCAPLSPAPYAPHAQPILFFSILPPAQGAHTSPKSTTTWNKQTSIFKTKEHTVNTVGTYVNKDTRCRHYEFRNWFQNAGW